MSVNGGVSSSEPVNAEGYLDALAPHAGRLAECLEVASYERRERETHLEFIFHGGENVRDKSNGNVRLHSISMGGDVLEECVASVLNQIDSPLSDPEPGHFAAVASLCYDPDTENKLEPAPDVVVRAVSTGDNLSRQSDVYQAIGSCFLRKPRTVGTSKSSGATTVHVDYQRGRTRKVTVRNNKLPGWLNGCIERQMACSVQPPERAVGDASWSVEWEY
jgi:hypothetical protein